MYEIFLESAEVDHNFFSHKNDMTLLTKIYKFIFKTSELRSALKAELLALYCT